LASNEERAEPAAKAQRGQSSVLRIGIVLRVADLNRWAKTMTTNLNIGGMVAAGFDDTGRYLLIVSHSGRGVFDFDTWLRVARDSDPVYPEKDVVVGIGPLEGVAVKVHEIDYNTGVLEFTSSDRSTSLHYSEGILAISSP
jgi:hypothetical protein